jgi:Asp-tRNA(Asn)/Glu-tRNA(Gln) amidotransferase A subunit family amidase
MTSMQSAHAILAAIAAGDAPPEHFVAHSLAAVARTDAGIGAFACLAALDENGPAPTGPLAGIAVGVKDIFDTADMPTTYGSPIYKDHRPVADAALVALFRRKGATVIGKTVTTEFAFLHPAATRNPRNPAHTPGGSSSGSAAAVAAGMVPVAIGTQTGGSVIRPAAYCGVTGFKPSFGLLPLVGAKTFSWSLDTAGLFAARAEDIAVLLERLTDRPMQSAPAETMPRSVGLYRTRIWNEAEPAMQQAVEHASRLAEAEGVRIVEIEEPSILADARAAHALIQNREAALALGHELRCHVDRLSPILRETLDAGLAVTPGRYDEAVALAEAARAAAGALFLQVDILLTPAATGSAPEGLGSTGSPVFNKLWTLTRNPCINVPGLTDAAGLPLGIQLVGRFGADRQVLGAASWFGKLLGGADAD